jgi:histone chaperone ASF1
MAGAEDTAGPVAEEDAASEAGSEEIDLEEESEGESDEEQEVDEEAGDDMEMDEAGPANGDKSHPQQPVQPSADVMVH